MNQLYGRIFTSIFDSSLAEDFVARHIFMDLLLVANDGVVDCTRQALSRRLNVPLDVLNAALDKLEGPDPASRDPEHEGRRLQRLDDHRDWGWVITNWEKYEQIRSGQDERAKTKERVRRYRERHRPPSALPQTEAASETASEGALASVTRNARTVTPSPTDGSDTRPADAGPARRQARGPSSPKASKGDPARIQRQQELVKQFAESYLERFGSEYQAARGRDQKAAWELVATMEPAQILEVARAAWSKLTGFLQQKAATLHGLQGCWNEITAALASVKPAPGKVAEHKYGGNVTHLL